MEPIETLPKRLFTELSSYLEEEKVKKVHDAYLFASEAHQNVFRRSGEPYICHPLSVALILAEIHMDAQGIMAAILHDVIEDAYVEKSTLQKKFGKEVAELVDGVTKLGKLDNTSLSRDEVKAASIRKMVSAMGRDIRVGLIKLADRQHNMSTLDSMPLDRQKAIAHETLTIYAPMAGKLGIHKFRTELETLSFSVLYPKRSQILAETTKHFHNERRKAIVQLESSIRKKLDEVGLGHCQILGREENYYNVYKYKKADHIGSFKIVYGKYANRLYTLRIITKTVDECYRVIGILHNLNEQCKPVSERFRDHIAIPQANGYQSLHTVLTVPELGHLKIKIRTRAMHYLAEWGIAACWLHKSEYEHINKDELLTPKWIQDFLEFQKATNNPIEFIEDLKIDLFQQPEICVFTPDGQPIKLPSNATVVDFAYALHTGVGHACVSARINGRPALLQTALRNEDTVEIITSSQEGRPNPSWLNFVTTAKARAEIRNYLSNFKKEDAIALGQRLLGKELDSLGYRYESLPPKRFNELLIRLHLSSLNDLLEDIGFGNRLPFLVARQLMHTETTPYPLGPLLLKGTEGITVRLADCCRPIPGDCIVGCFHPGQGIVVHIAECSQVDMLKNKHADWLDVQWNKKTRGEFPVAIQIELLDRVGTLSDVASVIKAMSANITDIRIDEKNAKPGRVVDIFTLLVKDRDHLANIMRSIRKLPVTEKVSRVKPSSHKRA